MNILLLTDELTTNPILSSLVYYAVLIVLFSLLFYIFVSFGRVLSRTATLSLYFFIASLLTIVFEKELALKITYLGIGSGIQAFLGLFTMPFYILYGALCNLLILIVDLLKNDGVHNFVVTLLSSYIFITIFHGLKFVVNALIFRKKKKKEIKISDYDY